MSITDVGLHRLVHHGDAGTTVAVVTPEWGANILGFAFHPRDLLWPVPFLEAADIASVAEKPTSYGIPVLGPTPGRIGATQAGAFRFDGRDYRMAQARHGFLRNLPWTVVERTPASITCAVDVRPDEALSTFPFEFRAEYSISVSEARLEAHLTLTGMGAEQPMSIGWHPYLQRDPRARLRIPASSFWELDAAAEPVPTGRVRPVSGLSDFRAGRVLEAQEHWDVTLTDLADDGGRVRCALESDVETRTIGGGAARVTVQRVVESSPVETPHIQLYTAPGRPALCLEPFSSPPDAVNLLANGHPRTGVRRLRRGETAAFAMALTLTVSG